MKFLYLFLLIFTFAAAGVSAAAPAHHASQRDFSYKRSTCPFNTAGLHVRELQCGYLTVPENRRKNDGRAIKLAVAVIKAPASDTKASPLIVLNGGPGGAILVPRVLKLLHAFFSGRDLVFLDQRGTGYSRTRLCQWLSKTWFEIGAMDLTSKHAELMWQGAVRACHDELLARGVDLSAYNVTENAADVNDLRQALGYAKWNVVGASYGGDLAQVEIRDYPAGVRSAILISPEPVAIPALGYNIASFARSLGKAFRRCTADKRCRASYPELRARFHATVSMLRQHPLMVTVETPSGKEPFVVNAQDFVGSVLFMLYPDGGAARFPAAVYAFNKRDKKAVARIVSKYGHGFPLAYGMFYSDVCYDQPASRAKWRAQAKAHSDLKSIGFWNAPCSYWEPEKAASAELKPVRSRIPVLVINGYFDPITPPQFIRKLLGGFPNATHVFLRRGSHVEPSRRTFGCLKRIAATFLNNPSAKPNTACAAQLPPLTLRPTRKQ